METDKAAELVMIVFAKMNKEQRLALIKILKAMRTKLDFNYPDGMPDQELKPDAGLILPK